MLSLKLHSCLVLVALITAQTAWGLDAKQATALAEQAAKAQILPAALAKRAVDETLRALLSLPSWSPLYPGAGVSTIGNNWASDAGAKTASGSLNFSTQDSRDKVANYYAKAFAAKGRVMEIRDEEPSTIEVTSGDETETMTLNLEKSQESGTISAVLNYNKAPTLR